MNPLQTLCLFVGAFLIGAGLTIMLLASAGKNDNPNDPYQGRVEGCLTFIFGTLPALLGCVFLIGAAVAGT